MPENQQAKFKDLPEAFWHIREHPLDYLPEKSLSLFHSFWDGYQTRYEDARRQIRAA